MSSNEFLHLPLNWITPFSLPADSGDKTIDLQKLFPEVDLASTQIMSLHMEAVTISFPRSPWCNCTRCRSSQAQMALLGHHCTLKTATGMYYAWRPGSPDVLAHPKS